MKAVAYYRISSTGQESGSGIERQQQIVRAYCNQNQIDLIKEYSETKTGTSEDRPIFEQLLTFILNNNINLIIIENVSRLSRELAVQEILIRKLRLLNINITSATEGSLDNDPTRVLVRQILGAVASHNKSELVHKLYMSRKMIRDKIGKCEGPKHYDNPEGIDLIVSMRSHGASYQAIADQLNAKQVPTKRNGSSWYPASVRKIWMYHSQSQSLDSAK